MQRRLMSTIPLLVAASVFVLTAPAFGAQQEHNHAAPAGSEHACACCGNSGAGAMNHAAEGGCCSNMAAEKTAKSDDGGCCAAKTAEAAPAAQMDHGANGCCASMAMGKGEADAKATDDAPVKNDAQAFPAENGAGTEREDAAPPLE